MSTEDTVNYHILMKGELDGFVKKLAKKEGPKEKPKHEAKGKKDDNTGKNNRGAYQPDNFYFVRAARIT